MNVIEKDLSGYSLDIVGLKVFSKSYKYYQDEIPFIAAEFLMAGLEKLKASTFFDLGDQTGAVGFEPSLLDRLKVKVLFSSQELKKPNFDDLQEFEVAANLNGKFLFLNVPNDVDVTNFFVYLKFYNIEGDYSLKLEQIFFEQVISNGQVLTGNFVDLRFGDSTIQTFPIQTEKEYQNTLATNNLQSTFNFNYISDLFYSFDVENQVNCFFGIDQKSYFMNNLSVGLLKQDPEFEKYVENNNFIISTKGSVYDDDSSFATSINVSQFNLGGVFGTLYESNFQISEYFNNYKKVGYTVSCTLEDAESKYILEVLKPSLDNEANILSELLDPAEDFTVVSKDKVSKTIALMQATYHQQFAVTQDKFVILDNSFNLVVNNDLISLLLSFNRAAAKTLNDATQIQDPAGKFFSTTSTIGRDFGQIIDFRKIALGANVISFENVPAPSLQSISVSDLLSRGNQEVQKFFGSNSHMSYSSLGGEEVVVNLLSNAFRGLTATTYMINAEPVLANVKDINYKFDYDAFLQYIEAINKIAAKNIDYNLSFYKAPLLESVTHQEYKTEESSKAVTGLLNSLTITQIPRLKTERDRKNYLTSIINIPKTFEIPSTLTTNICVENRKQSDDGVVTQKSFTPETFIGNNVLAFSVLTAIQSFAKKEFYDFYKSFIKKDLDLQSLPIQALFLYNYYNREQDTPAFLDKGSLLKQFVVYGIIYFMFKSLFRLTVFIPEQEEFVDITRDVVGLLNPNSEYLCRIEHYQNADLGMETPETLQTSIYNRYFVLIPGAAAGTSATTPTATATPATTTTITY